MTSIGPGGNEHRDLARRDRLAEAMEEVAGAIAQLPRANGKRLLDTAFRILEGVILLGLLFFAGAIYDHHSRLVAIENSRFKASDGLVVWQTLAECAKKEDVPAMKRVDRMEQRLDRHLEEEGD